MDYPWITLIVPRTSENRRAKDLVSGRSWVLGFLAIVSLFLIGCSVERINNEESGIIHAAAGLAPRLSSDRVRTYHAVSRYNQAS